MCTLILMHVASFAASLKHESCGLLCDAEGAMDFVRRNAVFAAGKHPDCTHPLRQLDRRSFKDRADLDVELPLRMLCFAPKYTGL